MSQRLADLMRRAGSLGPLVLFVVLIGAAVIVLAHPIADGWLPATICFVAAAVNALPAVWFLWYNAVVSAGPASTRIAGIVFGALPMALVATGLIAEGLRSAKAGGERTAATSSAPM